MMDLDEFIKSTTTQIVFGIHAASHGVADIDDTAFVNPRDTRDNHSEPVEVEFDVAVRVAGKSQGSVGGRFKVWNVLEAGGKTQQAHEHETVSRIGILVPVALPSCSAQRQKPRNTTVIRAGRGEVV